MRRNTRECYTNRYWTMIKVEARWLIAKNNRAANTRFVKLLETTGRGCDCSAAVVRLR